MHQSYLVKIALEAKSFLDRNLSLHRIVPDRLVFHVFPRLDSD